MAAPGSRSTLPPPEVDAVDEAAEGKPRRRLRLTTQQHVARELRNLYAMTLSGELSAIEAARRGRLLKTMAEVLTSSAIERRLKAIEGVVQTPGAAVSKAIENRLGKLERALGVVPVDQEDGGFYWLPAEKHLAGHEALIGLLALRPGIEAKIAELRANFVPGPVRVRRMSAAGRDQLDRLLATQPAQFGPAKVEPDHVPDPTQSR